MFLFGNCVCLRHINVRAFQPTIYTFVHFTFFWLLFLCYTSPFTQILLGHKYMFMLSMKNIWAKYKMILSNLKLVIVQPPNFDFVSRVRRHHWLEFFWVTNICLCCLWRTFEPNIKWFWATWNWSSCNHQILTLSRV